MKDVNIFTINVERNMYFQDYTITRSMDSISFRTHNLHLNYAEVLFPAIFQLKKGNIKYPLKLKNNNPISISIDSLPEPIAPITLKSEAVLTLKK